MTLTAQDWLAKIRALPLQKRVRIMNVCGGHERSITQAGLRGALPKNIDLIPGPGETHMTINRSMGQAGDPEGERLARWILSSPE